MATVLSRNTPQTPKHGSPILIRFPNILSMEPGLLIFTYGLWEAYWNVCSTFGESPKISLYPMKGLGGGDFFGAQDWNRHYVTGKHV